MLTALLLVAAASDSVNVGSAEGGIRVDGHLDEPAWATSEVVSDLLRFQPLEGGPPPGNTEIRFLQDERNLYVGVTVSEANYRLRARVSQRESINADDQIGIYLDTFSDRISGYIFYFNALGIQQDIRHNAGRWNPSWDTVIRSKGRLTENGFELEIAFPWRSLKFPAGGEQDWGVIVTRKIPHEGAKYSWPQLVRGTPRIFADANQLVGVHPPARGSGLELVPSITGGWTAPTDEPQRPLDVVRPSLDARFGITPDLGLAATINPDFSQVESDVSDVRLNARFAFAFPERRPFFLDGVDWFEDRGSTLYTRAMNRPIYGVKVGGREGPLTIGALHVLDQDPLPTFTEGGTPGFDAEDVDPDGTLASSTLVRARTDAFGLGYAGLVLGDKRILGGGSHQIGGVDFEVPLGDRWFAGSSFLHSFTGDGVHQLWGTQQNLSLSRASGVGTGMNARFTSRTPGFRKELGYNTQSDLVAGGVTVDHTFTPSGVLDTWQPTLWIDAQEEGNGDRYATVGHGQNFLLHGVHTLSFGGWLHSFRERGASVEGAGGRFAWGSNVGRTLDVIVNGSGGTTIDYEELVRATNGAISAITTLRPTPGIRTDTTAGIQLHQPKGQEVQRTQLVRNRVNWQFTPEFGARWVLDYSDGNTRDTRVYNALLLTWLRNPGTAVWLGGSIVSTPGEGTVEQTIFAKATLLLRP